MKRLGLFLDGVLDFLYPPIYCVCCERRLQKSAIHGICSQCSENLPFVHNPRCSICGKPAVSEDMVCMECKYHRHDYNQALAVFEYSLTVREMIHRYKYNGEHGLSRTFGYFLSGLLEESGWKADLMIPVPLHENRFKSRGFNQSALLADYLSQKTGIPCMENVLIRPLDTQTQTGLNRSKRAENLKNAFTTVGPETIRNKNILLIDDVHTTGATADSCSRVLRKAGAAKVYVITIATVISE